MKKLKYTTPVVALAAWLAGASASALPTPNTENAALKELQRVASEVEALRSATFMLDQDPNKKIIYVTPANRKQQAGQLAVIASPRCETLEGIYKMTYRLP